MDISNGWWFGPFHLDPHRAVLWRGKDALELRPKDFALLQYLVEQGDRLLRRDELLDAVWPETFVGDDVLRGGITRLRKVLGDHAKAPRYIATVPRRGYRWLGDTSTEPPDAATTLSSLSQTDLIGREKELRQLQDVLNHALTGQRRMVFLTGAAGLGKTTVVETFLAQVQASQTPPWTVVGQCVEHYGTGEAYLPILEALDRLCRSPSGSALVNLLRKRAPTWLAQMPWLLDDKDRIALAQELLGSTGERMMREMAEALEALSTETPLILVLEDLHWSDFATLDLIGFLAHRREPAKLLLIGTYRPEELSTTAHPLHGLMQTAHRDPRISELSLSLLSDLEVTAVLESRFPRHRFPPTLTTRLYRLTDGQPLYLAALLEAWIAQGVLAHNEGYWALEDASESFASGIPENLWQMISYRLERLSKQEQKMLEVASVVGVEFSGAMVAAGLSTQSPPTPHGTDISDQDPSTDVVTVEDRCEALARHGAIIERRGTITWPNGSASTAYGFCHALYREVMYERVAAARRQLLHRRIAICLEASHGERVEVIAGELALHWQQAGELQQAINYRQQAARNARGRHAYREGIAHLTSALELLHNLPETPQKAGQELAIHMALGAAWLVGRNPSAPEVEHAYRRARSLCLELSEDQRLAQALYALWMAYTTRGEFSKAREMGEELLELAHRKKNTASLLVAHHVLGNTVWWQGEFVLARQHIDQARSLDQEISNVRGLGANAKIARISNDAFAGPALCVMGYPEEAVRRSEQALTRARNLGHPHAVATALDLSANLLLYRGEARPALERAEELSSLGTRYGFEFWKAGGNILCGWARAQLGQVEEGISLMRLGLMQRRSGGGKVALEGHLVQLAGVYWRAGRDDELSSTLAQARSELEETGERSWEAERIRLEGEWLRRQDPSQEKQAEARFLEALRLSRRQQAKLWELRVAMSLCRLWHQQGKSEEGVDLLLTVYEWFSEGFEIADLRDAQELLEKMRSGGEAPL